MDPDLQHSPLSTSSDMGIVSQHLFIKSAFPESDEVAEGAPLEADAIVLPILEHNSNRLAPQVSSLSLGSNKELAAVADPPDGFTLGTISVDAPARPMVETPSSRLTLGRVVVLGEKKRGPLWFEKTLKLWQEVAAEIECMDSNIATKSFLCT